MITCPYTWCAPTGALILRVLRRPLTPDALHAVVAAASPELIRAMGGDRPGIPGLGRSALRELAAGVVGAHLAWLQAGCSVVRIEMDACRQIFAAGPAEDLPAPPASLAAAARMATAIQLAHPLEIASPDPRLPVLRIGALYAEASVDGAVAVYALAHVDRELRAYCSPQIWRRDRSAEEHRLLESSSYPGMCGRLWRLLSAVWTAPSERLIPVSPSTPTRRPSARREDVRRLELAPEVSAPPIRNRLIREDTPPPPAPAAHSGRPLLRVVTVPGYQRRIWVREDRCDTAEGVEALDAGAERQAADGGRLLGVLRPVRGHARGPMEGALHPRLRLARIVGADG